MQVIKTMPPFFNVVADGICTLEVPKGDTFHRFLLKLGGTSFTKAMITLIRAKLNGKVFYECTGSRLDSINQQKGLANSASYLAIDFNEIQAKTPGGMYAGAIGTAQGVDSFTLEITIAGATAPTLSAQAMVSGAQPLGQIMGMVATPVTYSAAGDYMLPIPHGKGVAPLVKRTHLFHANLTHLKVKKNGLEILEKTLLADYQFMQSEHGNTAQSGLFTYEPIMNRDLSGVLRVDNAQTLELWPTVSASDTIYVYREVLGHLHQF